MPDGCRGFAILESENGKFNRETSDQKEKKAEQLTILVVEDDPLVRLTTGSMLDELGHKYIEVESGEEAVQLLDEKAIDLVITDFSMRQMTGGELIERIRKYHPWVAVILASGNPIHAINVDAIALHKPYFTNDLERAIREALKKQQRENVARRDIP